MLIYSFIFLILRLSRRALQKAFFISYWALVQFLRSFSTNHDKCVAHVIVHFYLPPASNTNLTRTCCGA